MPKHNGWLPREGFTADLLGRIIKRTALNPTFTLPLILLARYTKKGSNLSILHEKAFSRVKLLFILGLIRWISNYFDAGVLNNWTSDKYEWEKEIIVVTGGAGGIGGEVVKLFSEKGIKVVVLDVIPMTFDAGPNVYYFKCDITNPSIIASTAAEIRNILKSSPTILINNAGVCRGKTILDSTEKDVRFTFDVNTLAHYFLAKEFLPSMIQANHGMVVTVASSAAYISIPNMVDYASSKSAALGFHEGLAAELKTRYNAPKVRTVVVNQGYTKTALFEGFGSSGFLIPTLEVETVAEAIVNQVLTGSSGQIIIPGFATTSTFLRGLPHWYQVGIRNDSQRLMENWKGRQVIDVEKHYDSAKKKDSSVSESGTLD